MIKQIVTGVDNSESAFAAARRAAELAVALDAELRVVSAYGKFEAERVEVGGDEFLLSTERSAMELADSVSARLHGEIPTARISTSAEEGKPGEALVRVADNLEADLIVVGNRRVQGPVRVLGSIARDVAAHASCDVYVVHTT
ncbi:universal stress protein [Rhodococcus sp. NPDC060090]|uniref:universal stress protein n=1 Tax=Rhodococcus sp. NPDC060090 TaxID=3347056 RepID=UPI003664F936